MGAANHQILEEGQTRRPRKPSIDLRAYDREARLRDGRPAPELFEDHPVTKYHGPAIEQLSTAEREALSMAITEAQRIYALGAERATKVADQALAAATKIVSFQPSRAHTIWTANHPQPEEPRHETQVQRQNADGGSRPGDLETADRQGPGPAGGDPKQVAEGPVDPGETRENVTEPGHLGSEVLDEDDEGPTRPTPESDEDTDATGELDTEEMSNAFAAALAASGGNTEDDE